MPHQYFSVLPAISLRYLELRNAFKVFSLNLSRVARIIRFSGNSRPSENLIEFQNVASYVLELLRICMCLNFCLLIFDAIELRQI